MKINEKDNPVEAINKFSHTLNETKKDMNKHRYHLRPALRRKEKSKEAFKKSCKKKTNPNGSVFDKKI